jgi:hypothetical protein
MDRTVRGSSTRDPFRSPGSSRAGAAIVPQANGNYMESAPIYQCFFAGYYIIWTFFVIPEISSGTGVTAYGREGKRVNESCP